MPSEDEQGAGGGGFETLNSSVEAHGAGGEISSLAVANETATQLHPGESHAGILHTGEEEWFVVDLAASTAVILEVGQQELDVKVLVRDPQGQELLAFDSPVGRKEPERVCFVTDRPGPFKIGITPFSGRGAYTLGWVREGPAVESDRYCARAARMFMAAESATRGASEERIANYQRAAALWKQAKEPFLEAMARREIASLLVDLGQSVRAAASFREALGLARRAGSAYLEVSLLNRLGLLLLDQGAVGGAESAFTEALVRSRVAGDRRGEASALSNLGLVDEAAGAPHLAIDRYLKAIPILRELEARVDLAQTLRNLANAYGLLDYHDEALDTLEEALAIAVLAGDEERQAIVLAAQAWVHYLRGRSELGLEPLRQALVLQRGRRDRNAQSALLDRQGTLFRETGQFAAALDSYQQSLEISEEDGSLRDAAATIMNLGCLLQELGRLDEATERLAEARKRFRQFEDPKIKSHIESCQALTERQRGESDKALQHIEAALAIVEDLRGNARSRGETYRPIWLWQNYSALHVELLLDLYLETGHENFAVRAFEASDFSRARSLFESVLESQIGLRARADPALLAQEREVQVRLNQTENERRRLQGEGAEVAQSALLESRLRALALELERVRSDLRAADPRYTRLAAPQKVGLQQIQALLEPGVVLLSFVLGDERTSLFAVRQGSLEVFRLQARERVETQAKALYQALKQSRFNAEQWPLAAETLGALLLPPGSLRASDRRLLVVPEGFLHYVPFAILPSPGRSGTPLGARQLVDNFEILHLPSASVLVALRQRSEQRPPASKTIAIFADPVFSFDDSRLRVSAEGASGMRREGVADRLLPDVLPRLVHTRAEAQTILAMAPAETSYVVLDFAATKQDVLSTDLSSYRFLHFATHAFINESFPALSGLALSRWDARGALIDGELFLHEVFNLQLAADLTVLSGCQTALGRQVRGDGLLSLTRGFLYAGSSQVLVSLWSVDDEATARLMAEVYRGLLLRDEEPATALRAAQLFMRQQPDWAAPYFWAPFVLQGG